MTAYGDYRGDRSRIDLFVRYVDSRCKMYQDELAYRIYVTDSLQSAPQNKYITKRYADRFAPEDNRTGDEIAEEVITKLGLKVE